MVMMSGAAIRAWLATCAIVGCASHSMRYSDIEMLGGQTCPHRDSCRLIGRSSNFSERNCECDSRCAFYNDCCVDAGASPRTVVRTRSPCMPIGGSNLGAYVESACPDDAHPLSDKCRNDDLSDPFLSAPVTDERARRTYRNHYCAQCNGAGAQLAPWTLRVDCPGAENYTFADLVRAGGAWTARGHRCDLLFFWPSGLRGGPRLCRANLTDACPPHYNRRTHVQACGAYMAVVVNNENVAYRNPHCALCNGNRVDDLRCVGGVVGRGGKPFSFALLLDVNRSDGDLVGIKGPAVTCPSGQKYDPFAKKCRELVCAVPGYKMSGGKCVKK